MTSPGFVGREVLREQLGERLHRLQHSQVKTLRAPWRWEDLPEPFREAYREQADRFLLPTVQAHADQQTAKALRDAAAAVSPTAFGFAVAIDLTARATTLHPNGDPR